MNCYPDPYDHPYQTVGSVRVRAVGCPLRTRRGCGVEGAWLAVVGVLTNAVTLLPYPQGVVLGVSFAALTALGEAVDPSSYQEDPRAWTQVGPQVPRVDHLDLSAFA